MRYFLQLAYAGGDFHGWQRQPNGSSVQQMIEEALSTIFRREISITGAGRTDAGVNARRMFAHFDIEEENGEVIADEGRLLSSLNKLCGRDISLQKLIPVAPDAHARFDASARTYKYFVIYEKSPFLKDFSWHSPTRLDIDAMNAASPLLLSTSDFTSFAKLHADAKTNICRLSRAEWSDFENIYGVPGIVFTITADRFLRNMVRAVVGTLVDMGRGKLDLEGLKRIIEAKDRCSAGTSMPAGGLFLWDVEYPYIG